MRVGHVAVLQAGEAPRFVRDPVDLEAVLRENFAVRVTKNGKLSGNAIPGADLRVFLRSRELQKELPVVDRLTEIPTYSCDWKLIQPGHNDGPQGERFFYTGEAVKPKREPALIRRFLSVMSFRSAADATNTVALALTVLLRNMWPGGKPLAALTANRSHAGKDTVRDFAAGRTRMTEISWHFKDWATQIEAVAALSDPKVGFLSIGNVRSQGQVIESGFVERIVTSPSSLMQSSKRRGDGYERNGDFVVSITANNGRFSTDLANRSLPIHLEVIGDIQNRECAIGDPRHDFLPKHQREIEAELCGLIENWKDRDCPLDKTAKHPMRSWAATIGGILKANGFDAFLGNWSLQRNVNDVTQEALGILALASEHDTWLRVDKLVETACDEGITPTLMTRRHCTTHKSMMRQLGVILSAHRDASLDVETDDGVKRFVVRRDRRTHRGQLATVYKFEVPRANEGTGRR